MAPSFSEPSIAPDASASVGPEVPSSPSPERLALLQPCPDQPDCYTYVIQKGDSLLSLAKYFGLDYQDILDRNPQIKNPAVIHVGQRITLPTPTR